jgi:hypothetical protein
VAFKALVFSPVLALALVGCAAVDLYSDRAVVYNLEAEDALDQGLLLNVVRASDRRPMQFTSVQTISGTASASASAGLTSIPIGPHSGTTYKTGMATGTFSGGPTFTIPVLDTQEFYQGVMSPVTSNLFDFYIHEEFTREEIYSLFIETIAISKASSDCKDRKSHTLECELVFVNSPDQEIDFYLFQTLIDYLINLGLTTEPVTSAKGGQKSAGDCASGSSSSSGSTGASTTGSSSSGSQCASQPPQYRFCFSPRTLHALAHVPEKIPTDLVAAKAGEPVPDRTNKALCSSPLKSLTEKQTQAATTTTKTTTWVSARRKVEITKVTNAADSDVAGQIAKKTNVGTIILSADIVTKLINIANTTYGADDTIEHREFIKHLKSFAGQQIVFSIYTRSTEGILYYLGRMVRHQLDMAAAGYPGAYRIKLEKSFVERQLSEHPCVQSTPREYCENFFVVKKGLEPSALAVSYKGERYYVPQDEDARGDTLHVLSIVKQLLAVNTSAKSLPQTSVLSVISP